MVVNVPYANYLYQEKHEFDCKLNYRYMRPHIIYFSYMRDGSETKTLNMISQRIHYRELIQIYK